MNYICEKRGKIDRLWGVFIKHLLQIQAAGIEVEYVKKGEIILDGNRYSPLYFENTMRYEPIGKGGVNVVLTGHDIQPLIDKLRRYTF